ncbi:ATP-binding protein [Deinococcus hopiensis]|uniref:histidine kinase n=1 Tax=Deinococcus hopiensis KR-140 TaxID=695939 RepID=A0A1W1UTR6_9DEIO|nr:GAF domain-containing protein [Deinococcus hopiensis]SMB84453.1 PAS domain S-box-containing protein [Deinococcus hopiensis KR-140]
MTGSAPAPFPLAYTDFDDFPDPFVLLDENWSVIFANQAAAQLRGLGSADLLGRRFQNLFAIAPGSDLDVVTRRVMQTRTGETFETYYPTLGVWAQGRIFTFRKGIGVLYQDVTNKKRAELRQQALYQITTELSRALATEDVIEIILRRAVPATNATSSAAGVLSRDGQTVQLLGAQNYSAELEARLARFPVTLDIPGAYVSSTGEAVFGTAQELESRFSAFREIRPEGLASMAVLPLQTSGRTFGFLALVFEEAERTFDDGERQFLMALAGQCAQAVDRVIQFTSAHEELRARQASEAALATERARLAAVLESLPVGVVIGEVPSARIVMGNAKIEEIFGHQVIYAQNLDEYRAWTGYHLDGRQIEPHEWPLVRVATSGETTKNEQMYYVRPDGARRVIDVTSAPIKAEDGSVIAGVVVIDDVTERRATEQAVRDLNVYLETQVQARTEELVARTRSLEAFVDFTEAAGTASDVHSLFRHALGVFRSFFNGCSAAYYERDGYLWRAQAWTEDIAPEVIASITGGIAEDAPAFSRAAITKEPVFVDGWDPTVEQVAATDEYGTVALYPLLVQGEVHAILAVGLKNALQWSERDQAVVRAAGRSLNLSVERADITVRLEAQRVALENRTRVLEAFGELTRDLGTFDDPMALIRRAQEIVLGLLPEGFAPYYEREGNLWRLRSQVGDRRNPTMQQIVDKGLPYESQSMRIPFETGEAYYQDVYDYTEDHFQIDWAQIGAVASLPVNVGGHVQGVFCVALFGQRGWTDADRALLETVSRSLGVALEAARSTAALKQRSLELERSNAELERFAYVASHDLQEPLRTVTSYADLLGMRYSGQLDGRAEKYLQYITQGSGRMRSLIHDLLAYSRLSSPAAERAQADAKDAFLRATANLETTIREAGAVVTAGEMPVVQVDEGRLTQVFQNLIGNAIKFRREGVPPAVHVHVRREGAYWHFTVVDNGLGIEPEYASRIFQVFQRLHTREAYEGNGIGLAICQKIVEQAGGQLWVESVPGEGSTFHFTLSAGGSAA